MSPNVIATKLLQPDRRCRESKMVVIRGWARGRWQEETENNRFIENALNADRIMNDLNGMANDSTPFFCFVFCTGEVCSGF